MAYFDINIIYLIKKITFFIKLYQNNWKQNPKLYRIRLHLKVSNLKNTLHNFHVH